LAPADNYAARSGSCRKPPGAPYNRNGRKRRLFFRFSALNRQAPYEAAARQPFRSEIIRKEYLRVSKSLATRQELIPYTALASLSIGDNRVDVELTADVKLKLHSTKRFGTISSSCGLCGKTSIDAIRQNFPAVRSADVRIDIETLLSLPETLHNAQSDFARTGGIHAAGIFGMDGQLKIAREDIGRHNAVDKAIGRAFLDELVPLKRHLLLVSGRASFEIIQKALAAGIPIVAAVSAPSSLAVEFARDSNQTLIGFLRPPSFNVYTHIERVILHNAATTSARQKPIPDLDRKFCLPQSNRSG